MKASRALGLSVTVIAAVIAASAAAVAGLGAQAKTHLEVAPAAPRPADVSTIEGIVKASYETISGGVGVPRQWARDFSLFDPHSRSVAVEVDAHGTVTTHSTSEPEFAAASDASLVQQGFSERELAHTIKQFGNVATVLSSYEGKSASTGRVSTRGVNIFQLYVDGERWGILSMVWDQERPGNPIPSELQ
jgi:hypothetical protein